MIVAIHQPNYAPWIGYFRKIARADHFFFLDDAAFSKGSVTNRVRILDSGKPAWLTVPAKPPLGTPILNVIPGQADWPQRHLSRLSNAYRLASAFAEVWPGVEQLYSELPAHNLAETNCLLIERYCERLGIEATFHRASEVPDILSGDDRLIALVRSIPEATGYLSGSGGRKYQDEGKFAAAGLSLDYNAYEPVPYPQISDGFAPGLSILDAVFNVGWDGAADLVSADLGSV
jgi:hypothetical protein